MQKMYFFCNLCFIFQNLTFLYGSLCAYFFNQSPNSRLSYNRGTIKKGRTKFQIAYDIMYNEGKKKNYILQKYI